MPNFKIKKFQFGNDENEWNAFLLNSKNSSFLFNRNFMDYHKDRFTDHSLMIYDEKDNLISCFLANEKDNLTIESHSGLTYGGFIFEKKIKLEIIIAIFNTVLDYYRKKDFNSLIYKAIPRIYNSIPSDEIEYCMFISNAKLIRRDTAIVINQNDKIKYSGNIRREARKAAKENIEVVESDDFEFFWNNILTPNLKERFGVNPVHSVDEIRLLKTNFPKQIKLYLAKKEENILAGTVFFLTKTVAHCQYISASDTGRKSGALNLLFTTLIDDALREKQYFDFGIVNENEGKSINSGMLGWKERMGGRATSHDFYKVNF